jgi:hypothetical protein
VGDGGVERTDVHGEQEAVSTIRMEGEVLQQAEGVVSVFDVRG